MRNVWAMRVKKLYTGLKRKSIEGAVIVIEDDTILDVLSAAQSDLLSSYSPKTVVDLSERYAAPGLIDVHVHLMLPGDGGAGEDTLAFAPQERTLMAEANARASLLAGCTALRDCGAADGVALTLRDFLLRTGSGPDILAAGMPVTSSCGHCNYMGGTADGPGELVRLVRKQCFDRVDFVKVMASAGGTKGVKQGLTFTGPELKAVVEEAHRLGLGATVHATEIEAVRAAVEAGADRIEHGYFMDYSGEQIYKDEALVEKILERDIMICHTLPVIESSNVRMREALSERRDPELEASLRYYEDFQRKVEELFRFHVERGVPFAAGSDAGWRSCAFSDSMLLGMEIMEKNGVSPEDVLYAATGAAARYIGREHSLGHIAKGYQADLVVVASDPGKGTRAFRNKPRVYKRGVLIPHS